MKLQLLLFEILLFCCLIIQSSFKQMFGDVSIYLQKSCFICCYLNVFVL